MTTTITYHPAWSPTPWPGLEAEHASAPGGDGLITWLALALALAIVGVAFGHLLIAAGLLTFQVGNALAAFPAMAGFGISVGTLRNEVERWNEPVPTLSAW